MKNNNKKMVADFYKRAIGQCDIEFASTIIADNYIQHNPQVIPNTFPFD